MLTDQTPTEALELLDVLRRQVEVVAADHATLVPIEPARPKGDCVLFSDRACTVTAHPRTPKG